LRQEWVPERWAARGLGQLCLARVEPLPRRAQASFPGPGPRVGFPPVRELSRLVELLLCPSLLIQKSSERLEWRRPGPPAQLAAAEWRVPPWFRLAEVWPVWPLQESLWESFLLARLAFPSPPVPGLVRALRVPPVGPRLALVSPV
jgi:hypothetical protein